MRPITREELIPYEEYERRREAARTAIIELKRRRRIAVGELLTLVFENRDTIRFQIQEMIRVERIVDPLKVQEELDVYNALLPGDGALSATLFIEITDPDRVQSDLDRLKGIDGDRTLALRAGSETVYGEFETGRSRDDKISAVHFVKFLPHPAWLQALREPTSRVSVELDHPHYRRQAEAAGALRLEWLRDLGQ